ncbi:MAG: hypothetical protein KF708_09545 [Pirellulales bacterium]|nr:hypothetical protein [Pirellulales bacterium]
MKFEVGMHFRKRAVWLTALALVSWSGCAMPHHVPRVEDGTRQSKSGRAPTTDAEVLAAGGSVADTAAIEKQRRAGSNIAPPAESISAQNLPPQDMAAIMAELQTLGAIDPAMQNQLMEDLKNTDPALWPGLVQSFRATLAYQRRAAGVATPTAQGAVPAEALATMPRDVPPPRILPAQGVAAAHPLDPASQQTVNALAQTTPGVDRLPPTNTTLLPTSEVVQASATAPAGEATNAVVPAVATMPVNEPEQVQPATLVTPVAASTAAAATPAAAIPVDWQSQLTTAIQAAESAPSVSPEDDVRRDAYLRLMYLVAGRRDDAMKPIAGATPAEQNFWSQELFGLATYLDRASTPDATARAAAALLALNEASGHLAESSPIAVRNLCFCIDVKSYGVYEKFASEEFQPGQTVVLYAEVENFKSEPSAEGFHTALKSRYLILDPQGQRVDEHEFPLTEEHCRNRRRDFFMTYYLKMPERIYDGQYTLQLTIEDTLGKKVGQSSTTFKVKAN